MAAYAALVSLTYIIDQIQNHPCPPISLDQAQVESLTEKLNLLQKFLESYNSCVDYSNEGDELEIRIADAAYAAEDVIESRIVDQIYASHGKELHARSTSHGDKLYCTYHFYRCLHEAMDFFNFFKCFQGPIDRVDQIGAGSIDLYEGLQKVIEEIDSIMEQVMEIKEKTAIHCDQKLRNSTIAPGPLRSSSNTMVGFDDELLEIMDKLAGGQPDRQIIPIVGMGGMGKTTLTRNVYANPLIKNHFDFCAWVTVSQEYDAREILREVLYHGNKEGMGDSSENELGEMLYKHLWSRRYLIVMDDMWSIEAWDKVSRYLPDNKNGSRIVITTRLSNLASQMTDSYHFGMKFLDEDKSWNLLCKTVFGERGCPLELEKIGKEIAKNCKGLPLSIVVTGGLLAKSKYSTEYWEYIVKNLNSLVNSEDGEHCLKVLYMSYKQLPVHLKPCFLYMGVFPEDHRIRANMLIRLWVAEGFLKPVRGKSLEEVAKECLDELISINLVHAVTRFEKIKYCRIHDLLRDLCLREAEKERFYINVKGVHSFSGTKGTNTQRRIVVHGKELEKEVGDKLQSMSLARCLIREDQFDPISLNFMLLRMVTELDDASRYEWCSLEDLFQLVNLRYFDIYSSRSIFPCAVNHLWNLHTLVVDSDSYITAPSEIWTMPQLRHVKFHAGLRLPDPPSCYIDKQDDVVLRNLQSLSTIIGFTNGGGGVINRISNLKKLRIHSSIVSDCEYYCLYDLDSLHKLEYFRYTVDDFSKLHQLSSGFLQNVTFPHSLKKLNLDASNLQFDNIMKRIGSLPLLEVLKLQCVSLKGCVWETVEGQFCRLKVLEIRRWRDLECWNTESTHFPCLEHLLLLQLYKLKEIPLSIAEIPTLQSIHLQNCSFSIASSAKKILEEQENLLGEVTLHVQVIIYSEKDAARLKSLATPNFQLISYRDPDNNRRHLPRLHHVLKGPGHRLFTAPRNIARVKSGILKVYQTAADKGLTTFAPNDEAFKTDICSAKMKEFKIAVITMLRGLNDVTKTGPIAIINYPINVC